MTIHGLKLKLKHLRCPENCAKHVSMLLEAITFDLTVGFSISLVFWKLDIYIFLGTPRLVQSKFGKILKYASKVRLEKGETADVNKGGQQHLCGCRPYKACQKMKGWFSTIKASRPFIL